MNILVVGKDGQLGSAFERHILRAKSSSKIKWVFVGKEVCDVTNPESIRKQVEKYDPNVIINCSAYTKVDDCETVEGENLSMKVNVLGNVNLANICLEKNIALITFSTDYVYGNTQISCPLMEGDAILSHPLNVYGQHKLKMEEMVSAILRGKNYLIFRVSCLCSLESKTSFVSKIVDKLGATEGHIDVVCDQIGTPTCCDDLVNFIIHVIEKQKYKNKSGVYNFSNEGMCSWYDFAMAIKEVFFKHSEVTIEPTRSFLNSKTAVRPMYSVMDKKKVKETFGITIPWWKDSLSKSR